MISRARWSGLLSVALAAVLAPASPASAAAAGKNDAAASRKTAPADDGWPRTPIGAVARGWVESFSTGEKAMKAYLEKNLTTQSLTTRPVHARIESYRKLRERYGSLELASVVEETPGELKVKLMAADASLHTFVFTVQRQPPHKLVSVGIVQQVQGHGGSGFHH